jgi:PPM family protein phosphatase
MEIRTGIEVAGLTDVGCQRENNEDCFSYWEPQDEGEFERKGRLAVIADGMGGYEGGQEASRLAVETVLEVYRETSTLDAQVSLIHALTAAHTRILRFADAHPELQGMGTTCTALSITGDRLNFAHVGDSRLYLVRGPQISRLTKDHSYVGRLVDSGILSPEEAEAHPQRHILTSALGAGSEVIPDFPEAAIVLQPDDVVILCTDGLWGLVKESELHDVAVEKPAAKACRQLVDLARKRGGPDNITVQVIHMS